MPVAVAADVRRGGAVSVSSRDVRASRLAAAQQEFEGLAARGVRIDGDGFSHIVLVKGDLNEAEQAGGTLLAGDDGRALRAALLRLGYAPEDFCALSARARQVSADRFNDQREETAEWLLDQVEQAAASGQPIPKGVVDGARAVMQELARSAALRDDSRFGDRKTVAIDAKVDGAGLADVYAKIAEAVKGEQE